MTTREYMISLLRAYLYSETVTLDADIDYNELFTLAKNHNLAAIIFCVIKRSENKDIVPTELYGKMEDSFFDAVFRYDQQSKTVESLSALLSENGIRHIFFKGAQIRDLYPVPEVRAMGDIDILISTEDRARVKDLLTANGYDAVNTNGPVYDYKKGEALIEMHTRIISGRVGNADAENGFADAMDHGVFDGCRGVLDADYCFAYLITHIAHHFWFHGAGAKLILDLGVMLTRYNINIDNVMDKVNSIGLGSFSEIVLALCNKWFGVGQAFPDADIADTEDFLLSYGAFGNTNRSNAAIVQRKEMEEGKVNSPLMTRIRLLFPSYKKLKNIPYIRFIEGRPWLTPIAWIYRFFYNIKNRRRFMMRTATDIGSKEANKLAKAELKYFEEIGLL